MANILANNNRNTDTNIIISTATSHVPRLLAKTNKLKHYNISCCKQLVRKELIIACTIVNTYSLIEMFAQSAPSNSNKLHTSVFPLSPYLFSLLFFIFALVVSVLVQTCIISWGNKSTRRSQRLCEDSELYDHVQLGHFGSLY